MVLTDLKDRGGVGDGDDDGYGDSDGDGDGLTVVLTDLKGQSGCW